MKNDVNQRDFRSRSQLHFAAEVGNVESILSLHKNGAKIDARDYVGATPLHRAAGGGNLVAVKTLLELGAPPDAVDKKGKRPSDWARLHGHDKVAMWLEGGNSKKRKQKRKR